MIVAITAKTRYAPQGTRCGVQQTIDPSAVKVSRIISRGICTFYGIDVQCVNQRFPHSSYVFLGKLSKPKVTHCTQIIMPG